MIDWLQIRNFAIAEQVDLEFESGLTTVTGETGSGKSIIVDAISILLGDRADNGFIKHSHSTAELQVGFALPEEHTAFTWLEEQNLKNENECILRRTIRRDKSSRAFINGQAVTASQLKHLGKELVDIHGQNEHHSLLQKQIQRQLLDTASGNLGLTIELNVVFRTLADIQSQIDQLNSESQATQERKDLLAFQLEELESLSPTSQEWIELEQAQKRAHHSKELTSGAQLIAAKLYEDESHNVNGMLSHCHQQLEQLSQYDDSLVPIAVMLEEARVNAEEAAKQLKHFYEGNLVDEEELDRIEERFSIYHHLARKHRLQPQALAEHMEDMKSELSNLKDPEAELARLFELQSVAHNNYRTLAQEISAKRAIHAESLSKEVTGIMQELGMKGGIFDIKLTPHDPDTFTRYGNESVEFTVTANSGQPLAPLNKVASGGELSRISLAIQVILAKQAQTPTLIFDEVDVGIGGSVADVVGKKLRDLGHSTQVICITHLSQVAAKGNHHFNVSKGSEGTVSAKVSKLEGSDRVEEIARMTSGAKLTEQSLAHAQEMLALA
ncbi:MAG: DNA repair protein RecN [Gammaproteobacteria bacterium]|nr:DNA repair protein RecN [Gammaproteobacteria bacterium]